MFDFGKIIDRKNFNSIKWGGMASKGFKHNDLLPFWIADMDFLSPPAVVEAVKTKAAHGVYGYTFVEDNYYNIPANWTKNRHGYNIGADTLVSAHGMLFSVVMTLKLFSNEGDKVLVNIPSYPPFLELVRESGRGLVTNELKLEGDKYVFDFDSFEKTIVSEGVKWFILSNPHNPTGRVWTKIELEKIWQICLKNKVRIINDEAWRDLIFSGSHFISLPSISKEIEDICVTCFSPTKTFNLAGLQTSFVSFPRKAEREKFKEEQALLHLNNMSYFAHIATEEAYSNCEPWLDELLKYLEDNRDYSISFIKNQMPRLKVTVPEGTYLLWIDVRDYKIDNLWAFMQDEAGLALNNGKTFGECGIGFMRLNFACPRCILEDGLNRLKKALDSLE